jgi:hypothetical protein
MRVSRFIGIPPKRFLQNSPGREQIDNCEEGGQPDDDRPPQEARGVALCAQWGVNIRGDISDIISFLDLHRSDERATSPIPRPP